jgi:hypothetical protein
VSKNNSVQLAFILALAWPLVHCADATQIDPRDQPSQALVTPSPTPTPAPASSEDQATLPVYRSVAAGITRIGSFNDHIFSTVAGAPLSYSDDGVGFQILANGSASRYLIYRCVITGFPDHFLTTDSGCEGFAQEGTLGYLEGAPTAVITRPVYRCSFPRPNYGHLATLDQAECVNAHFVVESILGYTL